MKKKKTKKVMVALDINTFRKLLDLSRNYRIAPEKMASTLLKQQLLIVERHVNDDRQAA